MSSLSQRLQARAVKIQQATALLPFAYSISMLVNRNVIRSFSRKAHLAPVTVIEYDIWCLHFIERGRGVELVQAIQNDVLIGEQFGNLVVVYFVALCLDWNVFARYIGYSSSNISKTERSL